MLSAYDWGQLPYSLDDVTVEDIGDILNILPIVRVEEKREYIHVSGFWARDLADDIRKHWGTARVSNNIFVELNARSFIAHQFFAVEIAYMMQELKKSPHSRTSKTVLDAITTGLLEQTWLGRSANKDPLKINWPALNELRKSPMKNQKEFIEQYADLSVKMNLKGNILYSKPGTGKTLAGFMFGLAFNQDAMFFLVPKVTVLEVWEGTANNEFYKKQDYWSSLSGTMPTGKEKYYFCHYEFFVNLMEHINLFKGRKITVWIDECHNFVEKTASRTRMLVQFVRQVIPEHVIWASGTPFKAVANEAIPCLETIDPLFTEEARVAYTKLYGAGDPRALDVFNHRIGRMMFKAELKDLVEIPLQEYDCNIKLPDGRRYTLPEVSKDMRAFLEDQMVFFEKNKFDYEYKWEQYTQRHSLKIRGGEQKMAFEQYKLYAKKMHNHFSQREDIELMKFCKQYEINHIEPELSGDSLKEWRHVTSVYKYAILVARGRALGRVLVGRRIECFKEMVEHSRYERYVEASESKTLIFSNYVEVAKEMVRYFETKKYHPVLVIGETTSQLEALLNRAKADPKANPVIATYKSLSTGVPMVMCNTVIFHDSPYRDYIKQQAVARVQRIGQIHKVHKVNTNLDTDGVPNLAGRAVDLLTWSKEQVAIMLGDEYKDINEDVV